MRKNESKNLLGWMAKKIFHNSKFKIKISKFGSKSSRGQVLGTALIMGAVILIFALAMVSMLSNSIKLRQKANAGTQGTLGADASVDKAIEVLKQGDNWGAPPSLSFTPIPGYKQDEVYTDIPNTQYVVQVDSGNLLNPPGDPAYERTISVDIYSFPKSVPSPVAQPTPWTLPGGSRPVSFSNHRTLQAVIRRGSVNASIIAGGSIATNGNFEVYWGNVYDYYQPSGCTSAPCTNVTTISLGNNQPLGPGYPAFHTMFGCIASSGSCGGCFGGSGSTSSTVCKTSDTGASTCQLFPNDPVMPPRPVVDLIKLKTAAQAYYSLNGVNSGETGYFWDSACSACSQVDSQPTAAYASSYEAGHQYTDAAGFDIMNNAATVLARMAKSLGQPAPNSGWVGADDLVFYVDTTDGKTPSSTNKTPGSSHDGSTDFKGFAFRGSFVLCGDYSCTGGQNGPSGTFSSPGSNWCPVTATLKPDINGFLFIAGDITKMVGSAPHIYGSIDLEGTYNASGNAKLYYRNNFDYGLIQSGTVALEKWQEVKSMPTRLP